jgi:NADH-quinone oxidoreductase subunit C/D
MAESTIDTLNDRGHELPREVTADGVPTAWSTPQDIHDVLETAKTEFPLLYDLTVVDERDRDGPTRSDFTVRYHLLSLGRDEALRLKAPLDSDHPKVTTVTDIWPAANWYEREAWDMFGVEFEGHPHLERLLMPKTWEGHPLRKEHPARATEMEPFELSLERRKREEKAMEFVPEEWGLERRSGDDEFLFLNVGPQHPGTHGVLRIVLQLDGEQIVDAVPDIGFHHRGVEKMAERQNWHTFIPYTDRVDYLSGVLNNLAYLLSVEKLAGIEIPPRARVIRVMMSELFRIASHLVWYGTFAQDVGQMSPVFYMFTDREQIFDVVEAICGGRMHPNWFRIGGVAQDLPDGWRDLVRGFLRDFPPRLDEYDDIVLDNPIFKARTVGVGAYDTTEAIEWGVTGPGLRATGMQWDIRKERPYSGYDAFDFDIPTAEEGDCHARARVRVEEIRQSLRIVEQCVDRMPDGPWKSDHPLTTPPRKARTMEDIETLINHFLGTSWGPVIPEGEAEVPIEGAKGLYSYYVVSTGDSRPYRVRVRTPSFPHMQFVPEISRGCMVPDLLAILGSVDFVLADIDR